MNYPTLKEARTADREQVWRWIRFLPGPANDEELSILTAVMSRVPEVGTLTPELSKKIGWEE